MNSKLFIAIVSTLFFINTNGQKNNLHISVDTTITGFHFATDFSGTMVYTKNGASDINNGSQPSAFSVTFSNEVSFNQSKTEVLKLLAMSVGNNYKISDRIEKDTLINGNTVYFISYQETLDAEKYQNFVFNGIVKRDNSVIVFTSGDLDHGVYIDGFKKTFFKISN